MALTRRTESSASNTSRPPIENLDERAYEARLIYVADLGMQHGQEYKGVQKANAQQISLGLEIVGETVVIDDKEQPRMLWTKPFNIFSTLTEKGNELKYYKIFNTKAKEGEVPDWESQLGKPCSVNVEHVTSGDNVYDNIESIMGIPEQYQAGVPPAIIEPAIGDADDPNNVVTKSLWGLPKWVYDRRIGAPPVAVKPTNTNSFDDDIPY